jgi:hypothetical protein
VLKSGRTITAPPAQVMPTLSGLDEKAPTHPRRPEQDTPPQGGRQGGRIMTPREHASHTAHHAFTVTAETTEADPTARLEVWRCLVCGLELETPPVRRPQEETP